MRILNQNDPFLFVRFIYFFVFVFNIYGESIQCVKFESGIVGNDFWLKR